MATKKEPEKTEKKVVVSDEQIQEELREREEMAKIRGEEKVETDAADAEEIKQALLKKEENKHINASTLDFDWDSVGKKSTTYKADKALELEEKYKKSLTRLSEGDIVKGKIVNITDREVVVNIGYKSEGVIPINQFRYMEDGPKVGQEIDVYIEKLEDANGQLKLSHTKARLMKAWDRINEVYKTGEIVRGYIKCRTKGGMIVDLWGIECFLPGSQIDVKPIRDYDAFVGQWMDFKVVRVNHEFKNVVVSHKAIIEEELEEQKKKIISQLERGQILEGTVKNITSYGVFMDLGGVDGLIHITDLSWGRINHPSELVELDQKLKVVVLDFDEEKKRIALGLKQLQPHPWEQLDPNLKEGDIVEGKVVAVTDFGAFVELKDYPGVEGLVHVSEMTWSTHPRNPHEFVKVGDEVKAKIISIDREERKMSLSFKRLKPDPWENIEEKYPIGSKHVGKVRAFTSFGVFVELEEGVDGLIHISDLSWTKKINHPAEFVQLGQEIEVVVIGIDKKNRRLALSHKAVEENPWDVYETIFKKNDIYQGVVTKIDGKTATIMLLPYGVEATADISHLQKEDGTTAQIDEKLPFKIIEFSKAAKKIVVSHRKVWEDAKKQEQGIDVEELKKKLENTLGSLPELQELKKKLENEESNTQQNNE